MLKVLSCIVLSVHKTLILPFLDLRYFYRLKRGRLIRIGGVLKRQAYTALNIASSTKLICFNQRYQESLKKAESSVQQ